MKTRIEIKDWKRIDSKTYKNINSGQIIIEKKYKTHFEYFDDFSQYLGRYNSETGIFNDGIVYIVIDSEYGGENK